MAYPSLESCPKQKWNEDVKLLKNPSHVSGLAALAVGVSNYASIFDTTRLLLKLNMTFLGYRIVWQIIMTLFIG